MQTAETHMARDRPESRAQPRAARRAWALGLLSLRARLALVAVLLAALAAAAAAGRMAQAPAARAAIGMLVVLVLAVLVAYARALAAEAEKRESLPEAAERQARERERPVETRTEELSALSTHLQELSEREKSELARNLHDELGGLLTAAKMDVSWLQSRTSPGALQERLAQLGGVLDEAMDLKRRVVEDLRPSLLDHFGLAPALRAYADSACAKAGLEADVRLGEETVGMPKDAAIALFRVIQEGLDNVIRHANARSIRLSMASEAHAYCLTLSDDGRGFDAADQKIRRSHGIVGMRQRALALGGSFEIDSRPGAGTTLRVTIPRGG